MYDNVTTQCRCFLIQKLLGPVHTYPFLFDHGYFFSGLAHRPHLSGENGHRKRIFSKNALQPEWKLLKTPAFCLRVDGRKRRFSNTMMSYIICRKSSIKHPGRLIFFKHFRAGVAYLNYSAKRINGNKGSCFL